MEAGGTSDLEPTYLWRVKVAGEDIMPLLTQLLC